MKSYTEIAKGAGLSISHVSRVLRGKSRPSVDVLIRLAWEMDMTAEEFMKKYKLSKKKGGNNK